jgi:hypothetical protein
MHRTIQVVDLQQLHQAGAQFSSWSPQAADLLAQVAQIVDSAVELRALHLPGDFGEGGGGRDGEGVSAESLAALEATVGLLDDDICHLVRAFKAACLALPRIPASGDYELHLKRNLKSAYVNELHTLVRRHTDLRKQYEPLLRSRASCVAVGVRRARDVWASVVEAIVALYHNVRCLAREHVKILALEAVQMRMSSHMRELQKTCAETVRSALRAEDNARNAGGRLCRIWPKSP